MRLPTCRLPAMGSDRRISVAGIVRRLRFLVLSRWRARVTTCPMRQRVARRRFDRCALEAYPQTITAAGVDHGPAHSVAYPVRREYFVPHIVSGNHHRTRLGAAVLQTPLQRIRRFRLDARLLHLGED